MKISIGLVTALAFATSGAEALAVSQYVKNACGSDYTAYCSEHEIGSNALRSCMRSVRKKLTQSCTQALADSGEATAEDIARYKRENGN